MCKSEEVHGLNKIPDYILLKLALKENGELKSYIQELEHELKYQQILKLNKSYKETIKTLKEKLRMHYYERNYSENIE